MKSKRLSLPNIRQTITDHGLAVRALFPSKGMFHSVRKGSKVSRYLRFYVERIQIKRIFGTNLAIMIIASSFIPQTNQPFLIGASGEIVNDGEIIYAGSPIVLKTDKTIQFPVTSMNISQGYKLYHPGIDIEGDLGDIIYPVMPGTVEAISYANYGYGNAIYIKHSDDTASLYAHLSHIFVEAGNFVDFNDPIGTMGSTGQSSGDHLHLEIRIKGIQINPLSLLPKLE